MHWSDSLPNLLIGLREGLEAGLVVSILLAAVHKAPGTGHRRSTRPVWFGVLGAVTAAVSFAAVLTASTDVVSSSAQEDVGGVLSVLAVALVTGMIFWMRRTARQLARHLRGDVTRAAAVGAGALALTAFLAVGREGLETTLFLWTAARASGETVAPLVGAFVGIALAVALCWLLVRRAIHLDLGTFFNRTAILLVVIAAGVLAYGLGDLQDAGLVPGAHWVAFDLTGHVDPGSWWVALVSGTTELAPRMTVLQVGAWSAYLAVVIPTFVAVGHRADADETAAPGMAGTAAPGTAPAPECGPRRWERMVDRRPWLAAGTLVAVPAVLAAVAVVALPASSEASTTAVTVTAGACAPEWTRGRTGGQTFAVTNRTGAVGEVNLVDGAGSVVAEIETIGPATTADLSATLGPGTYTLRCLMAGHATTSSDPVTVTRTAVGRDPAPPAVAPVTVADLRGPDTAYVTYAGGVLDTLAADVGAERRDLVAGDLAAARSGWLTAQLEWERVGASYDSFGDLGVAVDGLPDGLPGGVEDPDFTGLHRLEYGLWHGQSAAELLPVVDRLAADITTLGHQLPSVDVAGDPTDLPVRAHEILEDALRDHLSGLDDQGAGAGYPMTAADLQVTRVVLGELTPLVQTRAPGLVARADQEMDALQAALGSAGVVDPAGSAEWGTWQGPQATPITARQQVDAAIGALLETLSSVPDLLEVPPNRR